MPVTVNHVLTATTPDDPNYEIRPSHWNSAHVAALSATAGTEIYGAFSNDPAYNVSFTTNAGGQIVASANVTAAPSPVNVTGANGSSVNAQTLAFSNANGMTLGVSTAANGATVTGSYTVPTVPTAYVSSVNGSSGAISFATGSSLSSSQNGSTITWGLASNITTALQSAGAYLTTAAQSNQVVNSVNGSTGQISFATGSSLSSSQNGSTITWGLASNITTALQSAGAYLTTARASNDAIGLNTAQSNVTWTANSSGLSIDARGYAGTGTSVSGGAAVTLNSNGLQFNGNSLAGTTSGFTGANISASITHNTAGLAMSMSVAGAGGAASQTLYATGNTTVNSSGTMALSSLLMRGYGVVSLGTSNGSILVSSPDPTTLSPSWYAVGNTTAQSSSTTFAPDTISIQGTGGVSVGYSNGSLIISGATGGGGGGGGIAQAAGTQTATSGTVVLSNSNNITFGMSGSSQVTASAALNLYGLGNTTQNSSTVLGIGAVSLNGLGAMTVGYSNGSVQLSAPATSSLSATGNASLSVNGSTISVGANAAAVSVSGNSTSAGAGYSNVSSGTVYLAGGNNITLSQNGASITISGANAGGAQTGISGIQVSNTTYSSGTVTFQNANGISFGSSGANGISASYTVPSTAGLLSAVNVSAGTTSNNLSALTFADGNGVSFGLNASTITASVSQSVQTQASGAIAGSGVTTAGNNIGLSGTLNSAGLSLSATVAAQSNQSLGIYGSSQTFGQSSSSTYDARSLTIYGSGGVSVGWSNGSLGISGQTTTPQTNQTIGLYASSQTTGQSSSSTVDARSITFRGAGIVSVGLSGGEYIISATGGGGGVTPVVSANNGSYSFTTLSLSNANGISFGTSAGSAITASYTVPSVTQYFSATNTTFNGANISGSMTLNTNGLQLSMSVAAPGAAAENNNINLLGANTAGNTTASGSTIGYSGINLTLSGTNGSVVNISAPATSSLVGTGGISLSTNGSTISVSYTRGWVSNYENRGRNNNNTSFSSFGQNTVQFQHFIPDQEVRFSQIEWWARGSFASSTNSQVYAQTIRYGLYSQDGTGANSTRMTQVGSSSNVIQVSYNSNTAAGFTVQDGATSYTTTSGGTGIIANISGPFHHYLPFSSTLEPNIKWALGIAISSATTVGTSPFRYAPYIHTVQNSLSHARIFNTATAATATTVIGDREMGIYSVTSGALPSSYATSQISIAVSRQQLPFMLEV